MLIISKWAASPNSQSGPIPLAPSPSPLGRFALRFLNSKMPKESKGVTLASNGHVPNGTAPAVGRQKRKVKHEEVTDIVPLQRAITTYISYAIMIFWGYIWDTLRRVGLMNDMQGAVKDVRKRLSCVCL